MVRAPRNHSGDPPALSVPMSLPISATEVTPYAIQRSISSHDEECGVRVHVEQARNGEPPRLRPLLSSFPGTRMTRLGSDPLDPAVLDQERRALSETTGLEIENAHVAEQ